MIVATYRLQLNTSFDFDDARRAIPYLRRLGISHLYLSPVFQARPGSAHGYDVTDPTRISAELGGEDGFAALCDAARAHDMGIVLDVVPNHMAASEHNAWWMDVLTHGPRSRYARFFDIEWRAQRGRVLLPVLEAPYGDVLEAGKIRVERRAGELVVRYEEHVFPVDPATCSLALDGDPALARVNGRRGDPSSFDDLDHFLTAQPYRLAYWRLASREINYRRFFDITDLVGIRQEDPEVFEATHALVVKLASDGALHGVRIDHVDGLLDPLGYLRRLREALPREVTIHVEKILERTEALPRSWPVEGTTGYEFSAFVNGVLVDPRGARRLEEIGDRIAGGESGFHDVVVTQKRRVVRQLFAARVAWLGERLALLAERDRHARDATTDDFVQAIVETTAFLPVYRTYRAGPGLDARDRALIKQATREASAHAPEQAVGFLRRVLLLDLPHDASERWIDFGMRWQQLTGRAAAKGYEDTALYLYNRFVAANEVGASPDVPATSVEELHRFNAARARTHPRAMNATSTHDSKRSEDVRARIDVLSEIPDEWERRFAKWRATNPAPEGVDEILFYQTLIGVYPDAALTRRMQALMGKAAREAKKHTSWIRPNERYERALRSYVATSLAPDNERFWRDFRPLHDVVERHGRINSLAQTLLKIASPGVPDFYQGSESWHLRLVDPDNRKRVAFRKEPDEDHPKTRLIMRALAARASNPELFERGAYVALRVTGPRARHVVAFARSHRRRWAIAVTPRLTVALHGMKEPWHGTAIHVPPNAPGAWTDALTGRAHRAQRRTLPLAGLLDGEMPVALLTARS